MANRIFEAMAIETIEYLQFVQYFPNASNRFEVKMYR